MEYFNISPRLRTPGSACIHLESSHIKGSDCITSVMVSHQNGPVLTVSNHIASPGRGAWTHLQPPSLFLWPPSMSSVLKTASPARCRNINGRLIWHKISPFGPDLSRTSELLPTIKNFFVPHVSPSGVPGLIEGEKRVTSQPLR